MLTHMTFKMGKIIIGQSLGPRAIGKTLRFSICFLSYGLESFRLYIKFGFFKSYKRYKNLMNTSGSFLSISTNIVRNLVLRKILF